MVTERWALKEPTSTDRNPGFVTHPHAPSGVSVDRVDRVRVLDEGEVAVPKVDIEFAIAAHRLLSATVESGSAREYHSQRVERLRALLPKPPEPPSYEDILENNHVLRDMLEQEHAKVECVDPCLICREIAAKVA